MIISDFEHDIGNISDSILTQSLEMIENILSKYKQSRKVMFHLAIIKSNNTDIHSLLPTFTSNLEWYQLKVAQPNGNHNEFPQFDFLYSYREALPALNFRYEVGTNHVRPINICAKEAEDKCKLKFRLVEEPYNPPDHELFMRIAEDRNTCAADGKHRPLSLHVGIESSLAKQPELKEIIIGSRASRPDDLLIERGNEDGVILAPISMPYENVPRCRMIISVSPSADGHSLLDGKAAVLDIKFKKILPKTVASILITFIFLLCVSFLIILVSVIVFCWRKRRLSKQIASSSDSSRKNNQNSSNGKKTK